MPKTVRILYRILYLIPNVPNNINTAYWISSEKIWNKKKRKINPSNTGIFSACVFELSPINLENSAVPGSYAACGGNFLRTFGLFWNFGKELTLQTA